MGSGEKSPAVGLTDIVIRALEASDLEDADRIMRLAFGTFLDFPDPLNFLGDADYVRSRFRADPDAAFAAEESGKLIGTSFAAHWGSVAFLGPLTTHPEWWNQGVAQQLMGPVMERFSDWNTQHAGLYTFANSAKHLGLYQKFGFWPRFLRTVMSTLAFSGLEKVAQDSAIRDCSVLTSTIFDGLDVKREIRAVEDQNLGDTLIIPDEQGVAGFAVCHCGAGSEAGSGRCYIKFGAVRSGLMAEALLETLLSACDSFASKNNASRLIAGVSTGCSRAYRQLLRLGFRPDQVGVSMHNPDVVGYDREDVFVLDDWR